MSIKDLFLKPETRHKKQFDAKMASLGIMDVLHLLDLMSLDMKKAFLAQMAGLDSGLPKETKDKLAKGLAKAKENVSVKENLEILNNLGKPNRRDMIERCAMWHSRWADVEKKNGAEIKGELPSTVRMGILSTDIKTYDDLVEMANLSAGVEEVGFAAWSLLESCMNRKDLHVQESCVRKIGLESKAKERDDQRFNVSLNGLAKERERKEKQTQMSRAAAAQVLSQRH